MTDFNTMLYGDLDKIADVLSGDNPPELTTAEIRAILTNVCRKTDVLHRRIVRLEEGKL